MGSFKVIDAPAMAASYDPDPTQFLGIRLPVTFDTCEVIEERWANWMRQDPVVAIETQADNLRRLKARYIDGGEKDQFRSIVQCPQVRAPAERAWDCASLRGVPRQPRRRREAASLTRAPDLHRSSTPVRARFSNFAGLPTIADNDPQGAGPRGFAVRFHLAEHVHTDIIGHSVDAFSRE